MIKYAVLLLCVSPLLWGCESKDTSSKSDDVMFYSKQIQITCNEETLVDKTFKSKKECREFAREADIKCLGEKMTIECD